MRQVLRRQAGFTRRPTPARMPSTGNGGAACCSVTFASRGRELLLALRTAYAGELIHPQWESRRVDNGSLAVATFERDPGRTTADRGARRGCARAGRSGPARSPAESRAVRPAHRLERQLQDDGVPQQRPRSIRSPSRRLCLILGRPRCPDSRTAPGRRSRPRRRSRPGSGRTPLGRGRRAVPSDQHALDDRLQAEVELERPSPTKPR